MKHGLFLPPFAALADPRVLVELAQRAEASGWDGFFLWDHLDYAGSVGPIADPYVALGAVTASTAAIRVGVLVTPLIRRQIMVVARQIDTLRTLGAHRVIAGFGLGDDPPLGERREFDAPTSGGRRGREFSEGIELMRQLLDGSEIRHEGEFYRLTRDARRAASHVATPLWLAARWPNAAPIERAARYDGVVAISLSGPSDVIAMRQILTRAGANLETFDVVAWRESSPTTSTSEWCDAGVTWLLHGRWPRDVSYDELSKLVDTGPPS